MNIIYQLSQLPQEPFLALDPLSWILIAGTVISAGAQLWQAGKNQDIQKDINQDNINQSNLAYDRLRRDNLKDWDTTNKYNSPLEQMNRLRQAGLNPNLIYGKGAENTADAIRSSSTNPPSLIAPKLDIETNQIMNAVMAYQNVKQSNATIDNLNRNAGLQQAQKLNTEMDTASKAINNARTELEYQNAKELKDTTIQQAKLNLANSKQDLINKEAQGISLMNNNDTFWQNWELNRLAQSKNIEQTAQNILNLKAQNATSKEQLQLIKSQKVGTDFENEIKKWQVKLSEIGISPNDPYALRILQKLLQPKEDIRKPIQDREFDKTVQEILKNLQTNKPNK